MKWRYYSEKLALLFWESKLQSIKLQPNKFMTQPNELEVAKSAWHNQINSSDQDTQNQGWQAIPEVMTCSNFWSMRWLSCSYFWSSSNRLAVLSNTSSAAAVFFFSSSRWSWRTAELYFWALSSRRSAASRAWEDFEEGVDRPAFFKNVLLELFCDKTLETTSALGNGACPSATGCARIVSNDNYKMEKNELFKRLGTKVYWITTSK